MDHRCLYGHRVPSTFTYAIQSRSCPTCGAPTVTVAGYAAARKLATEGGLEAVAAFHAVRLLEGEWTLVPNAQGAQTARPATPAAPALLAPEEEAATAVHAPPASAAPPARAAAEEEEVVVDDEVVEVSPAPAPAPVAAPAKDPITEERPAVAVDAPDAPDARIKPISRAKAAEPAAPPPRKEPEARAAKTAFEPGEEDFFKGA